VDRTFCATLALVADWPRMSVARCPRLTAARACEKEANRRRAAQKKSCTGVEAGESDLLARRGD
jgi:hypothetical protein